MPLTEAEKHRITGDRDLGQLFQFSGSQDVRDAGKLMNVQAEKRLAEESRYRAPISLGKGIMIDPRTGQSTIDPNYTAQVKDEREAKSEFQRQKDAQALLRAQTMAQIKRDNPNITSSERKTMVDTENVITEASGLLDNWVSGSVNPTVDMFASVFDDSMLAPFKTVIEGKFYTPSQQQQRVAAAQMEAKISVALAGKNLTGFELEERRRWSPFTPGISDSESKRRLNALRDVFTRSLSTQRESLNLPVEPTTQQAAPPPPPVQTNTVTPVGKARPLSDGTVWQKMSDGTTVQVK